MPRKRRHLIRLRIPLPLRRISQGASPVMMTTMMKMRMTTKTRMTRTKMKMKTRMMRTKTTKTTKMKMTKMMMMTMKI